MLLGIYGRMASGLAGVFLIQFVINSVFFHDYLREHPLLVMQAVISGFCMRLFLLMLELALCAGMKDEQVHLVLSLYVIISCFVHFYTTQPLIRFLFLPGKMIHPGKDLAGMGTGEFLANAVGVEMILVGILFGLLAAYCKRKDIY